MEKTGKKRITGKRGRGADKRKKKIENEERDGRWGKKKEGGEGRTREGKRKEGSEGEEGN